MRILLVTPAPAGKWTGNRITAQRWAALWRGLGHAVAIAPAFDGQRCDLLVALHARKSHASIARFGRERPHAPLVVTLTGTDLYHDIRTPGRARRSLELASRLVVFQALGRAELPRRLRPKVRVMPQSAVAPRVAARRRADVFEACVLANLRHVKDPLRAALAARRLPSSSRLRVIHLGEALDRGLAARARAESARNARYRWLGVASHARTLRVLARSRLLVLTSRLEGGANVVSEALACGVPVLSSRIAGSIGLLGRSYPGYFPVGDSEALARLLHRCEAEPRFYRRLQAACRRRAAFFTPARERRAWGELLEEIRSLH